MRNKNLSLCLLVALLLRLAFVLIVFPHYQEKLKLREDGDDYGSIAQSIRDGHYDDIVRGPVYPVFVAVLNSSMAVKVVQALLDVLTCFLLWQLTKSEWTAWLWALYPFAIWRVAFINKETLLTFLIVAYVMLQWRAIRTSLIRDWLLSGALLGVINLCKPTFLLWPLVVLFFAPRRVGWLILGMLLVVAPWTVRNALVTARFLPIATEKGGLTTFVGNYQPAEGLWESPQKTNWVMASNSIRAQYPDGAVLELDRAFYEAAWEQVTGNPLKAVGMDIRKCGRFWFLSASRREQLASIFIQGAYLALALIGLWRMGIGGMATKLMLALIGYVMVLHALSYSDMRFSLLVMPYICVLASRTFVTRSAATLRS